MALKEEAFQTNTKLFKQKTKLLVT